MATRPSAWQSGDERTTAQCLIDVIGEAAWKKILITGLDYPSDDMKVGIDVDKMAEYAEPLIGPCVQLDPRGAYFSQKDVFEAVKAKSE